MTPTEILDQCVENLRSAGYSEPAWTMWRLPDGRYTACVSWEETHWLLSERKSDAGCDMTALTAARRAAKMVNKIAVDRCLTSMVCEIAIHKEGSEPWRWDCPNCDFAWPIEGNKHLAKDEFVCPDCNTIYTKRDIGPARSLKYGQGRVYLYDRKVVYKDRLGILMED